MSSKNRAQLLPPPFGEETGMAHVFAAAIHSAGAKRDAQFELLAVTSDVLDGKGIVIVRAPLGASVAVGVNQSTQHRCGLLKGAQGRVFVHGYGGPSGALFLCASLGWPTPSYLSWRESGPRTSVQCVTPSALDSTCITTELLRGSIFGLLHSGFPLMPLLQTAFGRTSGSSLPPAGEVENSPLFAGETIAAFDIIAIFRVVTIEARSRHSFGAPPQAAQLPCL